MCLSLAYDVPRTGLWVCAIVDSEEGTAVCPTHGASVRLRGTPERLNACVVHVLEQSYQTRGTSDTYADASVSEAV